MSTLPQIPSQRFAPAAITVAMAAVADLAGEGGHACEQRPVQRPVFKQRKMDKRKSRLMQDQAAFHLVPRRGLEPPRSYPLVPETSASTNSATWAGTQTASRPAQSVF